MSKAVLDAYRLKKVANFIEALNKASRDNSVQVDSYSWPFLRVDGFDADKLLVSWDSALREYVVSV